MFVGHDRGSDGQIRRRYFHNPHVGFKRGVKSAGQTPFGTPFRYTLLNFAPAPAAAGTGVSMYCTSCTVGAQHPLVAVPLDGLAERGCAPVCTMPWGGTRREGADNLAVARRLAICRSVLAFPARSREKICEGNIHTPHRQWGALRRAVPFWRVPLYATAEPSSVTHAALQGPGAASDASDVCLP
jgi:hypothetical protein